MSTKSRSSECDIVVHMKLDVGSTRSATSIIRALVPDNINFPEGLSVQMGRTGSTINVELKGKKARTSSVLGTVDEILEHVSLSEKVLSRNA